MYVKESTIAFLKSIQKSLNNQQIIIKNNSKYNTVIKTKTFRIKKKRGKI